MKIKLYYVIDDKICISFEDKIILSQGTPHRVVYSILREAWRTHEEFPKYRFPMIATPSTARWGKDNRLVHGPPIFTTIGTWRLK